MPLGTIINYNRLDKDMIGNVIVYESTSAFSPLSQSALKEATRSQV